MLTDTSNGGTDTQHWVTYNQYDQYANVLKSAQPSAVNTDNVSMVNGTSECGYNSSQADLNVSLNASGLIDVNIYYGDPGCDSDARSDPSRASDTGMLCASGVQQGSGATPDWQSSVDYTSATGSGENAVTVYETRQSTQFQDDEIGSTPPPASTTLPALRAPPTNTSSIRVGRSRSS